MVVISTPITTIAATRRPGARDRAPRGRHRRREREDALVSRRAPWWRRGRSRALRPRPPDGGQRAIRARPRVGLRRRRHRLGGDTHRTESEPEAVERLEGWVERRRRQYPCGWIPLVTIASSRSSATFRRSPRTALMSLAATEEADEPEILLLAAGGFRDLTRLASSNPALWSDILLSNREAIGAALDLYVAQLQLVRSAIVEERGEDVETTFDEAKSARLRLATKPQGASRRRRVAGRIARPPRRARPTDGRARGGRRSTSRTCRSPTHRRAVEAPCI